MIGLLRRAAPAERRSRSLARIVPPAILSRMRGRGPRELIRLALLNVRAGIRAAGRNERARRRADRAFDLRWGTETSSGLSVHELGIARSRLANCRRYDPSSEAMLREPLAALAIDPAAFDFIDYGSGKGRVLMLAMADGFARVTGVEISGKLCAIARDNVERFASQHEAMAPARILHVDAGRFEPRGRNILAYFYNPFDRLIMDEVRRRLEASLSAGSERIVVIYANPEHAEVFTEAGWEEGPRTAATRSFVARADDRPRAR